MQQLTVENELKITARRSLKPGDQFRLGGGTVCRGLPPVRGLFVCREIRSNVFRGSRRVFVDAVRVEGENQFGETRTFFVEGKPYTTKNAPGVRFVPYAVLPPNQKKKRGRVNR